jgi:hypothetical protein
MSSDQRLYSSTVKETSIAPSRAHVLVLGCCVLSRSHSLIPMSTVAPARSSRSLLCNEKTRMSRKTLVMLRLAVADRSSTRAG